MMVVWDAPAAPRTAWKVADEIGTLRHEAGCAVAWACRTAPQPAWRVPNGVLEPTSQHSFGNRSRRRRSTAGQGPTAAGGAAGIYTCGRRGPDSTSVGTQAKYITTMTALLAPSKATSSSSPTHPSGFVAVGGLEITVSELAAEAYEAASRADRRPLRRAQLVGCQTEGG